MIRDRTNRTAISVLLALWAVWYAAVWIAHPQGDLEEAVNGNLAVDLLRGPVVPIWYYQYQVWAHGPLIVGFFLTPLYALVGSTMAAVKLVGAVFAAWGTGVWTLLVRRAWGGAAAIVFLLWWLLPPPYLGRMLHVVWANHMETIALGGTILYLFLRAGTRPPTALSALGQGFFAGLAALFCLQALAFAAAVGACAVWRWGRAGARSLALFAAPGFLLGIAPRLVYRVAVGADYPVYPDLPAPAARLAALFTDVFPIVSGYAAAWGSLLAMALAAICSVALAVRAIARLRGVEPADRGAWLGRLLAVYAAVYLAVYTVGPHAVMVPSNPYWHRYVLPLFPVGMAAVAWALTRTRAGRLGWLALVPLLVLGAIDQKPLDRLRAVRDRIAERSVGWRLNAQRGDDYARFVYYNLPDAWTAEGYTIEQAAASVMRLPAEWRPSGAEVLGRWIGADETIRRLAADPAWLGALRADAAWGAGVDAIRRRYAAKDDRTDPAPVVAWIDSLAAVDPALADAFASGVGYQLTFGLAAKYGLRRNAPFIRGETAWDRAPMPDSGWRQNVEMHRDLAQNLLAVLDERQAAALAAGAGRFAAFENVGAGAHALWCDLLRAGDCTGLSDAFAGGEAEGAALRMLTALNHATPAVLADVNAGAVAAALARRGVTMRAVETPQTGWVLDRPSERAGGPAR